MNATHTPMIPLMRKKKLIGYVCGHCDAIWTANYTPSSPERMRTRRVGHEAGPGAKYVENKAHQRRAKAVKKAKKRWRQDHPKTVHHHHYYDENDQPAVLEHSHRYADVAHETNHKEAGVAKGLPIYWDHEGTDCE